MEKMSEILGVSLVHSNGRVTLPKYVRERLNVKDGDLVYFYIDEEGKVVVKKSERRRFTLR